MASISTFYLNSDTADNYPTGSQSTALPDGSDNSASNDSYSLGTTNNTGNTAISITSLGQTSPQSARFATFSTPALAAQTISSGTWTMNGGFTEGNNGCNAYLAISLYVWRPGSGLVGYIYDATTAIGNEFTGTESPTSYTWTGASQSTQAGDIVCCEVWYTASQSKTQGYAITCAKDTADFYLQPPAAISTFEGSLYYFCT